jgi:RimJ/RimL family protein N-acetyltransferase
LHAVSSGFKPKAAFRGLPPQTETEIDRWLKQLCGNGNEQFVVQAGERLVGHAVLCLAADKTEAELTLFVHQEFRGYGLGRSLVLGALHFACKQRHLKRVWMKVETANPLAQSALEKAEFHARDLNDLFHPELEMERVLQCDHCREEACVVFNSALPFSVPLPAGVVPTHDSGWGNHHSSPNDLP